MHPSHHSPDGNAAHCDLIARDPTALERERTRATIRATAEALAERTGVEVPQLEFLDGIVRFRGPPNHLTLVALVAEVRAISQRWHMKHFAVLLWRGEDE